MIFTFIRFRGNESSDLRLDLLRILQLIFIKFYFDNFLLLSYLNRIIVS